MAITVIQKSIMPLFENAPFTLISSDVASGASTLTVESINDLAVNKILFIGEPNGEDSEIIKTHGSTAPSGSTVTLAATCVFAHPIGTRVYVIDYDQIEFSHATTATGSKSVLATNNIDADIEPNVYRDASQSSGFYFSRFKNSIDASFGDYTDPVPFAGFAVTQVGKVIAKALKRNKLTTFTDFVDHEFCIDTINECLDDFNGELKKWQNLQLFNEIIGQITRGLQKIALPSTVWQYSNRSILQLYFADEGVLSYKDKREWEEEIMDGVLHTVLAAGSNTATGSTSITVSNSADLDESGTVMIEGQLITYTANSQSTGVLSGIPASGDGSITATLTAGADVWQGSYQEGAPDKYTIIEGYIYFWPLADSNSAGKTLFGDFWKVASYVDSDGDTLDLMRHDAAYYFLTWAIRAQIKNDGIRDLTDGDYQQYLNVRQKSVEMQLKTSGQKFKLKPRVNTIKFR